MCYNQARRYFFIYFHLSFRYAERFCRAFMISGQSLLVWHYEQHIYLSHILSGFSPWLYCLPCMTRLPSLDYIPRYARIRSYSLCRLTSYFASRRRHARHITPPSAYLMRAALATSPPLCASLPARSIYWYRVIYLSCVGFPFAFTYVWHFVLVI